MPAQQEKIKRPPKKHVVKNMLQKASKAKEGKLLHHLHQRPFAFKGNGDRVDGFNTKGM